MTETEGQGLSITRVAEMLGKSPKTILRMIRGGRLPAHKEQVDSHDRWVVDQLIDQDMTRTNAHADVLSADKDKTIAVLESEVATLKAQLAATNERLREAHILIGQQEGKLKALPQPGKRPWWMFWKR